MNRRAKVYVEESKRDTQAKLEAYLAGLREKGVDPQDLPKDTTVRKLRAVIRKAGLRLASIAAQEKLTRDLAQAKLAKLAAAQTPSEEVIEKAAPAKKEKRAKKEKVEKAESKKDKKEKKEKPKETEE